ncbi:MAG: phenylacetate--CoA ligase [Candidatus Hecatellales archaeon]|nr:MAG: phenylacetate--CoA ligase [Candidatus Hecatellales archaeon]
MKSWIYEPEYESMSREKLEELKLERVKRIVRYCYERVPLYRERFKEAKLTPDDIKTLEDLSKIPFTTKDDLRRNWPYGMLATDMESLATIHCSSGTTGTPTSALYTKNDIFNAWAKVMARVYAMMGLKKGDIMQIAYGYGLFTGGLGFHYGALEIGVIALPMSAGETERQLRLAKELKTTAIACTPTYALYLGEHTKEMGIDPTKDLKWKCGSFGAEPWSEEVRAKIEELLDLEAFDVYGLSEIIGPGVAHECDQHNGDHFFEDHFLTEVIDPESGEPVSEGEKGELVYTTLTREAMPLLRFRSGDIVPWWTFEECECGRTLMRAGRVIGRSDDMLKVRGVKFWPSTVEHALLSVRGASQHFRIVIERPKTLDVMTVEVEPVKELYDEVKGDLSKLEDLKKEIGEKIRSVVGISAVVKLVPVGTITRFMGKAKRVEDRRKVVPF